MSVRSADIAQTRGCPPNIRRSQVPFGFAIYAQKPRNSSLQGDPPGVQRWEPNPRCNIRTWRKTSINRAPATGQEWGESFTNLYSLTVDLYARIFMR